MNRHVWSFAAGVGITYIGNFIYCTKYRTDVGTWFFIAQTAHDALTPIFIAAGSLLALLVAYILFRLFQRYEKTILSGATVKGEAIVLEAQREARAIRSLADGEQRQDEPARRDVETEFLRKRECYLREIEGLKEERNRLMKEGTAKDEIIGWLQVGNRGAAERARKKLRVLQRGKGHDA